MNIDEMKFDDIVARMKSINEMDFEKLSNDEIDALNTETDQLLERKNVLLAGQAKHEKRNSLINKLNTGMVTPKDVTEDSDMVERKAFMDYFKTGDVSDVLSRADATVASGDLGVMIPHTVQQEILKEIDSIKGTIYSKVKKLSLKGGVEYPIGEFEATVTRITETTVSDRQKGGSITGSVVFGYKIGEIRLAQTFLETVLSVPAFEAELAKVIAAAFVKQMDIEIMTGDVSRQELEGITKNTKVKTIELTAEDMKDWKALQAKIFGKFPLGFKNLPYEFVMTNGTWESNIKTLADDNNRPVCSEAFNHVDGFMDCRFGGHGVTLVEPYVVADFDTAKKGEIFGMVWEPSSAYAINSNYDFTVVQYTDHEKNQIVKKALFVNDGHVLRPDRIYLLKKGETTASSGGTGGSGQS